MKITSLFGPKRPVFSFEVFPPQRDGDLQSLYRCFEELQTLKPDYISVTYGAGGSNMGMHFEVNTHLLKMGITPLAHFTCVGHSKASITEQLTRLQDAGVENVLALRGDPPKGASRFEKPLDGFGHADELIAFCKQHLSPIKCPRSIDFEVELPRHPTGKLYKRLLRDRYWQGRQSRIV